jgi:hypothetical protein
LEENRIDLILNKNNDNYLKTSNSVKLMNHIYEDNGFIKLKTVINSNIMIGDIIYICAMSGDTGVEYTSSSYVLDNLIEVSDCSNWYYNPKLMGYKVLNVDYLNNFLTIDRRYDSIFDDKNIYNHYITKIYINNQNIINGNIDGAIYKNVQLSGTTNFIQSIILSGITSNITLNEKYDKDYITLNTHDNYSTYLSNNNDLFSFTVIKNQTINNTIIQNGYYYNCIINNSKLNYGFYYDCVINNTIINNGNYSGCTISGVTWVYGVWEYGDFILSEWNDGIGIMVILLEKYGKMVFLIMVFFLRLLG